LSCGERNVNGRINQLLELTNQVGQMSKELQKLQKENEEYKSTSLRRSFAFVGETTSHETEPRCKKSKTSKQGQELEFKTSKQEKE